MVCVRRCTVCECVVCLLLVRVYLCGDDGVPTVTEGRRACAESLCCGARACVFYCARCRCTHTHPGGSISSHAGSGGRRWSVLWTGQKHSGADLPLSRNQRNHPQQRVCMCVCVCVETTVCVFALLCVGDAIRSPKAFHGRLCVWRARPWCGVVSCIIMLL